MVARGRQWKAVELKEGQGKDKRGLLRQGRESRKGKASQKDKAKQG